MRGWQGNIIVLQSVRRNDGHDHDHGLRRKRPPGNLGRSTNAILEQDSARETTLHNWPVKKTNNLRKG